MGISRQLLEDIRHHLLRPLANRIANLAARAVVTLVDDARKLQLLQIGVLADETLDEAERFQEYGFTSVPVAGAEAVVVFPNGDRGHPLVVAVDDRRYRPTGLQPGEVAVYHKDGAIVKFTTAGDVVVSPKAGRSVLLGGSGASAAVALRTDLLAINAAITAAIGAVVAGDGGAAALTALQTSLTGVGFPASATKVKAE